MGNTSITTVPFVSIYDWMDAIENAVMGHTYNSRHKDEIGVPPYDVYLTDDGCIFEIAVAGYDKDHLDISVDDNKVTVTARKIENTPDNLVNSRINRRGFKFTRVDVKRNYDLEKTKASLKDGILRIEIPYAEHAKKTKKKIDIE